MATPTPFISTTDLSDYTGRDVTADAMAVNACDAACDIVRSYVGQDFNSATETIVLDGTGTDCLLLPQIPVTSAGTVIAGGLALVSGTDYVLADGRKLIRTSGTAYTTNVGLGDFSVWPLGRQNVQVTYDHGYAGTVPSDVRAVALQIASRFVTQGIAISETVAGQSITYASPALDLTAGEKLILGRKRAW